MKKELKFRAWDQVKEKFWEPKFQGMTYFDIYSVPDFIGQTYTKESTTKFVKRFVIMECTGFKDQEGNEIYEGDIWENPNGRYVVEFRHFGWLPFADSRGCRCCNDEAYAPWQGKVIGNKYENPELLGEQKMSRLESIADEIDRLERERNEWRRKYFNLRGSIQDKIREWK